MSVPAFIHQGDSALERNYMMWQPQLFLAYVRTRSPAPRPGCQPHPYLLPQYMPSHRIPDAPTPVLRMKAVVAFIISSLQGLLVRLSANSPDPHAPFAH